MNRQRLSFCQEMNDILLRWLESPDTQPCLGLQSRPRRQKSPIFAFIMIRLLKQVTGLVLLIPVYFYRWFISPLTGPSCRHTPTCSQYAIDAVGHAGPVKGFMLATNRFLRCRPGGTHGYDPAPLIRIRRYRPGMTLTGRWKVSNRLRDH